MMKKILFVGFMAIFACGSAVNAEEHLLVRLQNELNLTRETHAGLPHKCGLPTLVEAYRADTRRTAALVAEHRLAKQSQSLDVYMSPSGHFEILYNPNQIPTYDRNSDGTPDYLEFVAKSFDRAWEVEIDSLGFSPPLDASGQPRDVYTVTCTSLGGTFYGITYFDTEIPSLPGFNYISEIEINTSFDFVDYPAANGDPIVRDSMAIAVTAAHEFNHALQVSYRFWYLNDVPTISNLMNLRFIEGSATYMEEVVADRVNDYYQYLPRFYERLNASNWDDDNARLLYGDVIFYIMLGEVYGKQITREFWEKKREVTGIYAQNAVLRDAKGSSLSEELRRFATWVFFSGSRTIAGEFFEEGSAYPNAIFEEGNASGIGENDEILVYSGNMPPLALEIVAVPVSSLNTTLPVKILPNRAQTDWLGASLYRSAPYEQLFESGVVADVRFTPPDDTLFLGVVSSLWSNTFDDDADYEIRIGNVTSEVLVVPNIIRPDTPVDFVKFVNLPENAKVVIFTSNGIRVADAVISDSGRTATWALRNFEGKTVSSGVYIYRIQSDTKTETGKLLIVR